MHRFFLFLILWACFCNSIYAADHHVMEGRIGKYPVILDIENDKTGKIKSATYFYTSKGFDLSLEGTYSGHDSLILRRMGWGRYGELDSVIEIFSLKKSGNGWKGKWIHRKQTLPVVLYPAEINKYNIKDIPDLDEGYSFAGLQYRKIKLSLFRYKGGNKIAVDGRYSYTWDTSFISGMVCLRVLSGYPPSLTDKINHAFKHYAYTQLDNFFACVINEKGIPGDFEVYHEQPYFTDSLISLYLINSWYCGGAHPDFSENSITVDARTGKKVNNLEELIWFTGKKPSYDKDGYLTDAYVVESAKTLVHILTELYPGQMKKPEESSGECDFTDIEVWKYPSWHFSSAGLHVSPYFPRVERHCDSPEFSNIPYGILKKYLAKK